MLPENRRLLAVKFLGYQKLYADFDCIGGWALLTPLVQESLYMKSWAGKGHIRESTSAMSWGGPNEPIPSFDSKILCFLDAWALKEQ